MYCELNLTNRLTDFIVFVMSLVLIGDKTCCNMKASASPAGHGKNTTVLGVHGETWRSTVKIHAGGHTFFKKRCNPVIYQLNYSSSLLHTLFDESGLPLTIESHKSIFIKLLSSMHFSLLYQDMGSGLDAEELVDVESQPRHKQVNTHFHLCTGL